ncbi:MAG: hypothetical protein A4E28_02892 [Methanocella sp. PtaU1.Bin125]|nr:MAG: hypothetical protein A4E28_02892 [Methanocella sp. PtaU1.Bin125]
MSGKFKKREIERKGSEKEQEKARKLLDENAEDLANPEKLNREFDKVTAPGEPGVTSKPKKREGI